MEHQANVIIPAPEKSSRLLAFLTLLFLVPKIVLLIPHFIILYFVGIAAFVVAILAQFVVLFTGRYPKGMHDFVVGYIRWQARLAAYFTGLRDEYPPFTFKE